MQLRTAALIAGAVVAAGAAFWAVRRGRQALAEDLNPTSSNNLAYRGASAVGDAIANDGQERALGARIWEWLNPGQAAAERDVLSPSVRRDVSIASAAYGPEVSWRPHGSAVNTGGASGTW